MNTYQNFLTDEQIAMNSILTSNSLTKEFNCLWLVEPCTWNKTEFSVEIVQFIEQTQGVNTLPNLILIGMLSHQIDIYVQCTRHIANDGLLEIYNKGATSGPSIYFSMADKALNRILQLMKELGITPSHRIGKVRSTSPEALEFENFMNGT